MCFASIRICLPSSLIERALHWSLVIPNQIVVPSKVLLVFATGVVRKPTSVITGKASAFVAPTDFVAPLALSLAPRALFCPPRALVRFTRRFVASRRCHDAAHQRPKAKGARPKAQGQRPKARGQRPEARGRRPEETGYDPSVWANKVLSRWVKSLFPHPINQAETLRLCCFQSYLLGLI